MGLQEIQWAGPKSVLGALKTYVFFKEMMDFQFWEHSRRSPPPYGVPRVPDALRGVHFDLPEAPFLPPGEVAEK